ncbi:hypothetical protein [Streptomyces jeddahensis]|uniref:Uncharacterized protein n=1 Tax=Streptomyces jeddahensis TaxID=1716141 RepID=A0A177HR00_9ACTN|nr:hypothetical protein [Streptomyces jeddahensis]OAH12867.1 hypothetical protein STSP_39040 [Streptomyces jeddahensis]
MRRRSAGAVGYARPVGNGEAAGPRHVASGTAHGNWLTLGKDGRLTLYAPTDGGLLRWSETAVGGPAWSGPHFVAVADLTDLTVAQGADGYVHLLGRRQRTGSDGARSVDIVHAIQYQTGRAVTDWRSLGNPHKDHEQGRGLGVPVGAIASDGTVHVFVRSAGRGLMLRREAPNGKWKAWEDLLGSGIDAPPAAVALSGGRGEVCAAAETGVWMWRQAEAGGSFATPRGFALRPTPGTVAALETGPDRATYFWTDAADGGTVAWRPGGWPVALGPAPAERPYAALRTALDGYDCVVLACRGQDGTAVLGVGGTENEANGFWWYALPERCQGTPALARDGLGRVVMALIDPDGVPRLARQDEGAGLAFTRWQRL